MKTLQDVASCLSDYDPNALPVARAQEFIRRFVAPIAVTEQVAVRSALDRVLAVDIVSPINVPAHDNSAMDGFAFDGAQLSSEELTLDTIGTGFAGKQFTGSVGPGQCVRIMTGAVMPPGSDTVAPQEFCRVDGTRVTIPPSAKLRRGDNRRQRGEDLTAGEPALRAGKTLRPADLGLIASLGFPEVRVMHRLRVAFFSTGDELRSIGEPLGAGEIYDSNRYTIYGMLRRLGVEPIDMGVVRDDPSALEAAFRSAAGNADAIVTSGGVSVGEADFTKQTMAKLGDVAFWTIAMRPGRPMAFGRVWAGDRKGEGPSAYLFGLPGNPVAVMVTFYHFVRDALLYMQGAQGIPLPFVRARCDTALRKRPGRTEYQRGILLSDAAGGYRVRLTGQQGSGVLRSMSEANGFVVLGHDQGSVDAGDFVDFLPFEGLV